MESDLEVRVDLVVPACEIVELASRSSGPGGQHVNTSSTRVTLRWNVLESRALAPHLRQRLLEGLRSRLTGGGELIVHADRSRSRARNREAARSRMRELIAGALQERVPRRETKPTMGARRRWRNAKEQRSSLKQNRRRVHTRDD